MAAVRSAALESFAGVCAVLAAFAGVLYSIAFVIISRNAPQLGLTLSGLFLLLGGLLSAAVMVALYQRLRDVDSGFALLALLLGIAAALGALLHGGFDLANGLHPPVALAADQPSEIDPRGLLTFAVAGLAILGFSWLMGRASYFPGGLAALGYLLGVLLLLIYFGRLIVLDPKSLLILAPAGLTGLIVNPAWYLWIGVRLLRGA